ncbi:hypothetical protein D3C84_1177930 [compost metagenome]
MRTLHRVKVRKRQVLDAIQLRRARRCDADVGALAGWISADYQKVITRAEVAVTGTGR